MLTGTQFILRDYSWKCFAWNRKLLIHNTTLNI